MTTASEPAWLKAARAKLGTREIPGPTHNNRLIAFLNTASRWNGVIWRDDEMPWCGGFAAACLVEVGIEPPKIAARAASWGGWGARLRVERLSPGAIMVYSRPGGHHVNFYTGEDERYFYGIGGNQKNAVTETRIARNRLIASRWPRGVDVIGSPVSRTAAAGTSVSDNEA